MDWQIVHIRINDAATGQPTPVRLRLGSDHRYFPPLGRPDVIPVEWGESVGGCLQIGNRSYSYIDGSCEARLPAGQLHVEISKGPEFAPVHETVELLPGQLSLRLGITRRFDLAAEGWYAGDTHAQFLTPHAAALEGAAEGLQTVNLLASAAYLPDLLHFSGQVPALESHGSTVVTNTLNDGGDLGRLSLLNCHRIVFPLTLDAAGFERYTLADWSQQCHRKGGLAVWPRFPAEPGEAIANLLLGAIDAVEWTAPDPFAVAGLPEWYRLLNLGFRVPLVGGSGKGSNAIPLGAARTCAYLGAKREFNYGRWIDAIRSGQTFVTRGPLLRLTVNGLGPGADVADDSAANQTPIAAQVEAFAVEPFERVELVRDGEIVADAMPDADNVARISANVAPGISGWLAARCWSADGLSAHTSPIYLGGAKPTANPALAKPLFQQLDWLTSFAEDHAADAAQERHLLEIAARARGELEKRLQ